MDWNTIRTGFSGVPTAPPPPSHPMAPAAKTNTIDDNHETLLNILIPHNCPAYSAVSSNTRW